MQRLGTLIALSLLRDPGIRLLVLWNVRAKRDHRRMAR